MPKLTINLGPKKPTEHAFFAVILFYLALKVDVTFETNLHFTLLKAQHHHAILWYSLSKYALIKRFPAQELDKNSRERDQRRGKKSHKEKHREKHKKKKKKKFQSDSGDSSDSGSDIEFLS